MVLLELLMWLWHTVYGSIAPAGVLGSASRAAYASLIFVLAWN